MSRNEAIEQLLEHSGRGRRLPDPFQRRYLREHARISQRALALALGVQPSTLCRWESGAREPRRGPVLAAYLDVLDRLAAEQ